MKQSCKDLYIINYRFQGLAGKICKTQKLCSQFRKSLGLDLKKIMVGLDLKDVIDPGGFLQILQDTEKYTIIIDFSGD
jgi:hypothetical protein